MHVHWIGQHCAIKWRKCSAMSQPESSLQAGAVLRLVPDTTKNKKAGHCKVILTSDAIMMRNDALAGFRRLAVAMQLQASPSHITSPGHWEWGPSSLSKCQ